MISSLASCCGSVIVAVVHLGLLSMILLQFSRHGAHTDGVLLLCSLPSTGSIISASSLSSHYYTGVVPASIISASSLVLLHRRYHDASTAFSSYVDCLCTSTTTSSPAVSLAHDSMLVMSDTTPQPLSTAVAMVRRTLHFFLLPLLALNPVC